MASPCAKVFCGARRIALADQALDITLGNRRCFGDRVEHLAL